jgi:hypothetical protein
VEEEESKTDPRWKPYAAWVATAEAGRESSARQGCGTTGRRDAERGFGCSSDAAGQSLAEGSSEDSDVIGSRSTVQREAHLREREETGRAQARIVWLRPSFDATWVPNAPHACPQLGSSRASDRHDGGGALHVRAGLE